MRNSGEPRSILAVRSLADLGEPPEDPRARAAWVRDRFVALGRLAIECKAGTAHPWVAFYDHRRTVPETTRAWFLEGPMCRDADIPRHGSQALLEGWLAADGLPVDRLATHAVSALGKDPKDGAKNFVQDAALQALSFAQARAARPINMIGDQTLPNEWFVLPLVVAKAPLFACYLAEGGEVVLERVERFDLAMQSPDGRRRVYVVSEEELVRMASALRKCMRAWLSNVEEEQPQNDLS